MNIKLFLNNIANKAGYDIKKLNTAASLRTTAFESYTLMKELGLVPKTVVDVGIADGTPEL